MSAWDYIPADFGCEDEEGDAEGGPGYYTPRGEVRCAFCGTRGLEWTDDNGRWRLLHSNGRVHVCQSGPRAPAKPTDFPELG